MQVTGKLCIKAWRLDNEQTTHISLDLQDDSSGEYVALGDFELADGQMLTIDPCSLDAELASEMLIESDNMLQSITTGISVAPASHEYHPDSSGLTVTSHENAPGTAPEPEKAPGTAPEPEKAPLARPEPVKQPERPQTPPKPSEAPPQTPPGRKPRMGR